VGSFFFKSRAISAIFSRMQPKRIILIRHGESEGNFDENFYAKKPDYAMELTDKGRQQAVECGQRLKQIIQNESVMFYISPFWRTRETFENIVAQLNLPEIKLREEPRIREQEWGHLREPDERDRVTREREAYGSFYYRIPDGESCADVYDRVTTFMETMHRDFAKDDFPDNAVLVIHGMTIRLFLMRWFQWTVEEFEMIAHPPNCAIITMNLTADGKYQLETPMPQKDKLTHSYQRPLRLQT